MAIHFALKKAIHYIQHTFVIISTDNATIVSYINKQGGTRSPNLCIEVWEILHWCQKHNITLQIRDLPGKFNILVDRLSRLDKPINTEWSLDQRVANCIFHMLNFPIVDLFATCFNHKLAPYVSPVPDNQAFAIDALSMNWHYHAYAFPPIVLILPILTNIRQSRCRIVLIPPLWPQCPWFAEVLQLLVSAPMLRRTVRLQSPFSILRR